MNKQEPRSVGIWIRVSTEDQAQGESPEHHEYRARMYAESKGWKVARVYNLSAVSGKSVKDHKECEHGKKKGTWKVYDEAGELTKTQKFR